MSVRIFIGERLDEGRREIPADEMIVFEFGDGAIIKIHVDERGVVRAYADDGALVVLPQSSNVVSLKPESRAARTAAYRVRKALDNATVVEPADVRALAEAVLR